MFGHFMYACFTYIVMDVFTMDDDDCMKLMQQWLFVSFLIVEAIRRLDAYGQQRANGDKRFIFCFRQPSVVLKTLLALHWFVLVPCFMVWTVFGTVWLGQTVAAHPTYLYEGAPPLLVIIW